jgi:hypothetical protein
MNAITLDSPSAPTTTTSSTRWIARISAGLVIAFLGFDTTLKLLQLPPAMAAAQELGYPPGSFVWIGIVQMLCFGLYVIPRTAPIGAVLWTGYLGGAIATHVRLDHPLFSHTLFPLYVAVLLWLPLYLRDTRVRALVTSTG